MFTLGRYLYLLTVALWFGSVAFFTVAGLLIFGAFDKVSRLPAEERPHWLPLPAIYDAATPGKGFPEPLRLEQGSRAAGVAVGGIFPFYYMLQAGCALVAVLSAMLLAGSVEVSLPRLRTVLAFLALVTVLVGWWMEVKVDVLRIPRNTLTDQALSGSGSIEDARGARAVFGMWHGFSLLQNFATLGLVTLLLFLVPLTRQQPTTGNRA